MPWMAWQCPKDSESFIKLLIFSRPINKHYANGLLTDLGLSIPLKIFFENLIDKCVSASVDRAIDNTLLKRSMFHSHLSYFHHQIQDIKSFGSMKQAACLVCGRPQKDVYSTCQHSHSETP